mgnify:CR=1 FL=1
MKKIKECRNETTLVALLFIGIVMVLIAYRIFSFLCEVKAFAWWMILLGAMCAALGIVGFMMAYRAWRRLQYLRDHKDEVE